MKVTVDEMSGFCFGVVRAITTAERSMAEGRKVYSLGDIVHNRVEVQRLHDLGLLTARHEDLGELAGATVLIRAHGEPPSVYRTAGELGINIIDATCPVVGKLQRKVKKAYEAMQEAGGQVVILGKKGHAEVIGLTGQVGGDALVVESAEDLDAVDFERSVYLLSQTTQSLALFNRIKQEIISRASDPSKVIVDDTICRQVANREPHLREFASRFGAVVFVSGKKSSNGRVLFGVCADTNPRSYFIEDEGELDTAWFADVDTVGVCGATSTPKWLMNKVAEKISKL